MGSDIENTLREWSRAFDKKLSDLLITDEDSPPALLEAMRYSLLAPGKRFRPFLVHEAAMISGGSEADGLGAAAAIECVHAFSLIHDDLPCMDDDAERRGQPSCHVRFGEAMAVLAGDALLSAAFELLTRCYEDGPRVRMMVRELALASGAPGMIGGQVEDLLSESAPADWARTERVHRLKTARLIQSACILGVLAARGQDDVRKLLSDYGMHLGLAFQIADDLLDVGISTAEILDGARSGKQTAPRAVGMEEARRRAWQAANQAVECLVTLGPRADRLRALARFVVERTT